MMADAAMIRLPMRLVTFMVVYSFVGVTRFHELRVR